MIFAAPRLCAPIVDGARPVPIGGESWRTSRICLPPSFAGREFRHALTGAQIRPTSNDDESWFFAGQILEHVPAGIVLS